MAKLFNGRGGASGVLKTVEILQLLSLVVRQWRCFRLSTECAPLGVNRDWYPQVLQFLDMVVDELVLCNDRCSKGFVHRQVVDVPVVMRQSTGAFERISCVFCVTVNLALKFWDAFEESNVLHTAAGFCLAEYGRFWLYSRPLSGFIVPRDQGRNPGGGQVVDRRVAVCLPMTQIMGEIVVVFQIVLHCVAPVWHMVQVHVLL